MRRIALSQIVTLCTLVLSWNRCPSFFAALDITAATLHALGLEWVALVMLTPAITPKTVVHWSIIGFER